MNRYPNNYSQHSTSQNQFRPRPNFGSSLARFINNSRFSSPVSTGRGHNSSAAYQPKAVYNYRTAPPNRFQPRNDSHGVWPPRSHVPTAPSEETEMQIQDNESSQPLQKQSDKIQTEPTDTTGLNSKINQIGPNTNQENIPAASKLTGQFENVDKQDENTNANLKQAGPSDSPSVISNAEEKAKETGENKTAKMDGEKDEDDDNDDDDDGSSDEDTSYCKYCKRSFTSSVAYHSHTRGVVHMNLYMEAKAAKTQAQTSAAPETTEGQKNQGLLIQPGQIDSFLNEKKQKKLERQQNKVSKSKESVLDTQVTQSDDQNGDGQDESQFDSEVGQFDPGNSGYDDNIEIAHSARFENADHGANRMGQFYNYETSGSVKGKFNGRGRTQDNNTWQTSQNYGYDKYGYEGERGVSTREFDDTGEQQFGDFYGTREVYGTHSSSAEPSQTYGRDNEYENCRQFGSASVSGNQPPQSQNKTENGRQRNTQDKEYGNTEEMSSQLEEEEDDDEEEENDASFCKYCQLSFKSAMAYHAHTRGLQHTTLIMDARQKKGDQRFRKEKVDPEVLKVEIPEPIMEKPRINEADVPEDYNFETNWMNLDDELIKRLKSKTKAAERDLNPDEIGKKQFSDDFSCAVCNMKCTSALTFKMHIDGKTHKANMEHLESGNKFKLKQKKSGNTVYAAVDGEDIQSQFSQVIGNYKENALLGLEFITEFQKPDPKAACRYVCNLCEAKCDSSTIQPHVIGVKHKLHYFRETHYDIYEHLTKYTSKKKKSEMNVNAEDFAKQIEEKEGRKDVRVKIELDAGTGDNDLTEIMTRMSKALKEKLQEVENKEKDDAENKPSQESVEPKGELSGLSKSGTIPTTKGGNKPTTKAAKGSQFKLSDYIGPEPQGSGNHGPFRIPPPPRDMREPRGLPRHRFGAPPRDPYEQPRDPYGDGSDRFGSSRHYTAHRGHYTRDPPVGPSDPFRTSAYYEDPRYESGRLSGDFFRYEDESRRLDQMLDYRLSDPYDERRRLDDLYYRRQRLREQESCRLDSLLLDRHKLSDPTLETRRLEDIMERKKKLAEAEKTRLDDIMRRKRILDEQDPEKLRLERYDKLRKTTTDQDVTAAKETDRPSMEELIARRRANNAAAGQESRPLADQSLLPSSYSGSAAATSSMPPPTSSTAPPALSYGAQPQSAQSQGSQSALNTVQQVAANKELQEELARNPGVNIGELLGNLSSSMIATEDDAAMALQISNALTQALLRFRLQHATKQLSKPESAKPYEPKAIPGLGSISTTESDKSVPSFLRTTTGTASKPSSDQLHYDPSLPQAAKKRTTSDRSELQTNTKKARSALPESLPQTDLLKSIREQAAKLQARISSKTPPSATTSQHGIQAHSQFVHGQNPHGDQSGAAMSSPSSQYSGASVTGQYTNASSVDQSQPVIPSSESAVTHVNPSFYAHWYKTMYGKEDVYTTVPQPPQGFHPDAKAQPPQPATSADWYKTMYGNMPNSALQPVPPVHSQGPPLPFSVPALAPPPPPHEVIKKK